MILLHTLSIYAFLKEPLSINVLYEKQVENTVGETYRIYLDQLIKTINELSKNAGYKIDLVNVLAHNEYSKIPIYDRVSIFAGSNDVEKRMNALREIKDENIILAISSNLEEDLEQYGEVTAEKISYMVNLDSASNMNNDLLTSLHHAVLHVLSKVFGFVVPNLLDKKNTEERAIFMNNIKSLEKKKKEEDEKLRRMESISKESSERKLDDNGEDINEISKKIEGDRDEKEKDDGIKSRLIEADTLVNQFDKIMNFLKKKDNNEEFKDETKEDKTKPNDKQNASDEKSIKENKKGNNIHKTRLKINSDKKKENTNNEEKDEISLKDTLKEIIVELKNLRFDISESQIKKNDFPPRYVDREFVTSKRTFNTPFRHYEDFKNENIISVPLVDKKKDFQPFNFKDKKLTTSDLKLVQENNKES
ncbi:hypothetical protein COBT_001583 [Conglomerata obtusa]